MILNRIKYSIYSIHIAFREATTGSGSALLKVLKRYRVRERKW